MLVLRRADRLAHVKALSASSDEVVARSIGASYFWIEASDSPSFARRRADAWPSAFSTSPCSRPRPARAPIESPVRAFTASSVTTYWLPRPAIEPVSIALIPSRSQISRG